MQQESLSNVLGGSEFTSLLGVLPFISAFVIFMMTHDYIQEILQLEFQTQNAIIPNVFTFWDCLGCAVGPYILSRYLSTTSIHPFFTEFNKQKPHLRSVFVPLALLTTAGVGLANASLHLVNYPVKVTVKSFKLIPTMIVSTLVLRKTYARTKYISAALLCLGLAQFLLSDRQSAKKPSSSLGIFFLMLSCCVDAVAPVLQDKAMNTLQAPPLYVMFSTNITATLVMLVVLFFDGECFTALSIYYNHPMLLIYSTLYATSAFLGIYAYMLMVKEVGGVGTALVSMLRKVATVMLSFIVHGRIFNVGYAMGGGMIVAALLVSKLCGKGGGSSKNATAIKTNEIEMKMQKKNSSTEKVEEV